MNPSSNPVIVFLKRLWPIWLLLFLASLAIVVIGSGNVGRVVFRVSSTIFTLFLLGWLAYYFSGVAQKKRRLGLGGYFRMLGLGGFLLTIVLLFELFNDTNIRIILWDKQYSLHKSNFQFFLMIGFASIAILFFGEVLVYMERNDDKLNTKNK